MAELQGGRANRSAKERESKEGERNFRTTERGEIEGRDNQGESPLFLRQHENRTKSKNTKTNFRTPWAKKMTAEI